MAWVRLDDQVPRHAKILAVGPAAAWLWVCAIAHCQSQLTDGFVSNLAISMIGVPAPQAKRLAELLVNVGLFDKVDGGYRVHDYLHHNPCRVDVLAKRAEDSERKKNPNLPRIPKGFRADSERIPVAPSHPIPSHPVVLSEQQQSGPLSPPKPQPKVHGRVTLHHWQRDALLQALGPHAEQFNLDDWLLNDLSQRTGVIPLDRDARWKWLQQEFQARCQKLGLGGQAQTTGSFTERWANFARTLEAHKEPQHGH